MGYTVYKLGEYANVTKYAVRTNSIYFVRVQYKTDYIYYFVRINLKFICNGAIIRRVFHKANIVNSLLHAARPLRQKQLIHHTIPAASQDRTERKLTFEEKYKTKAKKITKQFQLKIDLKICFSFYFSVSFSFVEDEYICIHYIQLLTS